MKDRRILVSHSAQLDGWTNECANWVFNDPDYMFDDQRRTEMRPAVTAAVTYILAENDESAEVFKDRKYADAFIISEIGRWIAYEVPELKGIGKSNAAYRERLAQLKSIIFREEV